MSVDAQMEFVLARVAEDEEIARKAEESPGTYRGHPSGTAPLWTVTNANSYGSEIGPRGSVEATPGRVLAECEAKRRILAFARYADKIYADKAVDPDRDRDRFGLHYLMGQAHGYHAVVAAMAAAYADHPDYQEGWANL